MKLENYIIISVVFAMMLVGAFTIQADWDDYYSGTDLSVATKEKVTAVRDTNELGKELQTKVLQLSTKAAAFDLTAIYDLPGLFVDVGAYLMKIPNIMGQTVEAAFKSLKISLPTWFYTGIMTVIGIIVVMKVVSIFLKRESI